MNPKSRSAVRRSLMASILLLLPLIAACTQNKPNPESSPSIDAPPSGVEDAMMEETGGQIAGSDLLTVYLLDRNGYVAPMTMGENLQNASPDAEAAAALAWMTENGGLEGQLPEGFSPILPEGTKVNAIEMDTKSKTMNIDFADPFPGVIAANERKMLEAIVWTMTELPGIDKVKLTVAGEPLRTLPSSKTPVYDVLTRSIGINVELAEGLQVNRSMAVTLYFSARSSDGEGYFVPVTRLVERQPDRTKAALEQLIKGPKNQEALQSTLTSDIGIEKLTLMADTVNVELNDEGWEPKKEVPAEMMKALVLTMTEAAGVPQVKVVMNGDDSFLDTEDQSYELPVTRPLAINALKR